MFLINNKAAYNFTFDGSMDGIFTAVFESFERKIIPEALINKKFYQPAAFVSCIEIETSSEKAGRVWKALQEKLDKSWLRKIYCAFLSESTIAHQSIFSLLIYIFKSAKGAENNYGNAHVISVSKFAKSVEREKHRMEAFIRFKELADGIFYCGIDPDFNVIPLISNHFKQRYADQKWLIYDIKRKYGIFYNLHEVVEVQMNFNSWENKLGKASLMDPKEENYETLWRDYFKSTNIESRKNTKLHVQHVPKRYWRYLTEKFDR